MDHIHALIDQKIEELEREGNFKKEKLFLQHGTTTVYEHSIAVAKMSCLLAMQLHLTIDLDALIYGALLHDSFLYDWHDKSRGERWHGFTHPGISLRNAERDYHLGAIEKDIIRHHMFPLTLTPPRTKEGWVVCMADKICATRETVFRTRHEEIQPPMPPMGPEVGR